VVHACTHRIRPLLERKTIVILNDTVPIEKFICGVVYLHEIFLHDIQTPFLKFSFGFGFYRNSG
jgi:hypothetical protein